MRPSPLGKHGDIDRKNGVINVTVEVGDIANLVPQFHHPAGTTATPASGVAQNLFQSGKVYHRVQ